MSEEKKNELVEKNEVVEKKLVVLPDTGLVTLMSQEEYCKYLDSIYDR